MASNIKTVLEMDGLTRLPIFSEKNGSPCFDFNKIIPMPQGLLRSGEDKEDMLAAVVYYLTDRLSPQEDWNSVILDFMDISGKANKLPGCQSRENLLHVGRKSFLNAVCYLFANKDADLPELYLVGKALTSLYKKHGYIYATDWMRANWGVHENARDCTILDDNTISFTTPWEAPIPILRKLAEMYPDAEIEFQYASEEVGCYCGSGEDVGDGALAVHTFIEDSQEALETYVKVWGPSKCLVQDSYGVWRRKDCDFCDGCD